MARPVFSLRRPRRPELPADPRRGERGATLTEYGFVVALVVVAAMGGIMQLQDESGSYLVETGSDVGQPRELAADMSADLPDEPDWLPQPPAPTTTTTAPTTTSTTVATTAATAATSSTTAGPSSTTSTTAAATTTTTAAATTTTTAAAYPTGAVIYEGAMYSDRHNSECYQVENPGQVGSSISRHNCDNGNDQKLAAVGSATVVALKWTDAPNAGLCVSAGAAEATMATCNGSTAQLFTVTVTSGWIQYKSQSNNLCIAEYGDEWQMQTCSGSSDRQRFKFP